MSDTRKQCEEWLREAADGDAMICACPSCGPDLTGSLIAFVGAQVAEAIQNLPHDSACTFGKWDSLMRVTRDDCTCFRGEALQRAIPREERTK